MIFVVEDEPVLRRSLVEFLATVGHPAEGFEDAETALAAALRAPPDLVVSDLGLPRMGGLELLQQIAQIDPSIVRIAITAHGTVRTAIQALREGCYEYLEKPCDMQRLLRVVGRALDARRSNLELSWLRGARGNHSAAGSAGNSPIRGESESIRLLRQQITSVASLPGPLPPIFISGETGVGKSLLAREIHALRPNPSAPWIEVNCAALPSTLIEAELFGFERAAFTDAKQAKPGLFEAATGGGLFLDEVAELPLEAQAKLLRVVECGAVRRLGSVSERKIEVTLITASNVDLPAAVAAGTFRQDLYHRLAALTIWVPPLRERGSDVVLLARVFMSEISARYKKLLTLSDEAEDRLATYRWPGNIRELRFAIERAVILAAPGKSVLDSEDLQIGPKARDATPPPRTAPTAVVSDPVPEIPVRAAEITSHHSGVRVCLPADGIAFEELERAIFAAALERTGGNVVHTARLLRLKRDAVRYRMKKLGLSGDDDTSLVSEPDGPPEPT